MPAFLGIDRWGVWLMGVVALVWTVDCFSGLYLTLPPPRRTRTKAVSARDVLLDARRQGNDARFNGNGGT